MSDLKPCPFCGEQGPAAALVDFDGYHFTACECGAEGPAKNTRAFAVAAWNTRPGEEALQAEIERLRDELGRWERAAQWAGGGA